MQHCTSDELECLVSDRSAIVYTSTPPFTWGIFGFPAPQGIAIVIGEAPTRSEAKKAAREALDAMVDNVPSLSEIKKERF